jgi:hypothetical protein
MAYTFHEELQDLFRYHDGSRVLTPGDWPKRRNELLEALSTHVYGSLPLPAPVSGELLYEGKPKALPGIRHQHWQITVLTNPVITVLLDLYIPEGDDVYPVVLYGDGCWEYTNHELKTEIVRRGYVFAIFSRLQFAPDANRKEKDSGLYTRYPDIDFGALAAWAWGYHRMLDFLTEHENADETRCAITGHSRGGKAVLLAAATDERIALCNPNNSGHNGAGCYRFAGEGAERCEHSATWHSYWYNERFKEYAGRDGEIPVDGHFLKAAIAPRPLLTTEALGDLWANPAGAWQTFCAAREVYQFLGVEEYLGTLYRDGTHAHSWRDWMSFLNFADMHLQGKPWEQDLAANPFPENPQAFSWKSPSQR